MRVLTKVFSSSIRWGGGLSGRFGEIFGTHVLQWTRRLHYDTLDLEAMILQEIYLFLGPLKYTSFLKVTYLKLM